MEEPYWETEVPVETFIVPQLSVRHYMKAKVVQFLRWNKRFADRPAQIFAFHLDDLDAAQLRQLSDTIVGIIKLTMDEHLGAKGPADKNGAETTPGM